MRLTTAITPGGAESGVGEERLSPPNAEAAALGHGPGEKQEFGQEFGQEQVLG